MVKKLFLSLGLASLVVSGAFACTPGGCTPGFWKQSHHLDYWETNSPDNLYGGTFGVALAPDVTLLEALWLKGNKDGLTQLVRASTASLLNLNAGLNLIVVINGSTYKMKGIEDVDILKGLVQEAFAGAIDVEELKDELDKANNERCPF